MKCDEKLYVYFEIKIYTIKKILTYRYINDIAVLDEFCAKDCLSSVSRNKLLPTGYSI